MVKISPGSSIRELQSWRRWWKFPEVDPSGEQVQCEQKIPREEWGASADPSGWQAECP